jgi:pentatricopeptide repeat protein
MISEFAKHACSLEAMNLFEEMQQMGMHRDEVHLCMVDKGRSYFKLMTGEHNVSPNVLHYSCMVDSP